MDSTLNIEEAAAYLKIGQKAFKALFESGEIPGVSMNQKHTVFLRSELDDWIRRKGEEQAQARRVPTPIVQPKPAEKGPGIRVPRRLPDLAAAEARAKA